VLNGDQAEERWITVDDLDVLLLRSEPSVQRPWARTTGIHFGRIAVRRGVIVLNHPNGLAKAANKLYLQTFPADIRPKTLITRDVAQIRGFLSEQGTLILKPLQGAGGRNVFIAHVANSANLDQMIQAVSRDGYVIAQEYLPAAEEGDTRLFLMNGVPLQYRGKYAAFRRIGSGEDIRSNIHAGGRLRHAEVNDQMLHLAEVVRPRLIEDGMFLVGLDIVGDKLMEINVFSPGGLGSAHMFEKVNFERAVVEALERKVRYVGRYERSLNSVDVATL
jgi:glutathione synthase